MNWILLLLGALAGAFRAVHDAIAHGAPRLTARGPWWNNATSWTLKYKNYYGGDKRPRFFGATTFFVFATDAWHCFAALSWACADAALLLTGWPKYHWYAVGAVVLRRVIFEPLYRFLRK